MNKRCLIAFGPVFVLLSGLVSCAPDETEQDVYRAPAPLLVRGGRVLSLSQGQHMNGIEADLQAVLDMTAAGAERIELQSQCASTHVNVQAHQQFDGRRAIPLFRAVPEAVLALDLRRQPTQCTFRVTHINSVGSRNIHVLSGIKLTEPVEPAVSLLNADPDLQLTYDKLSEVLIQDRSGQERSADLVCTDLKVRGGAFRDVLRFDSFDLRHPLINPGRGREHLVANPRQLCRVVTIQNGEKHAVSAPFNLLMPVLPLKVEELSFYNTLANAAQTAGMAEASRSREIVLGKYIIKNDEPATRWLLVSKQSLAATVVHLRYRTGPLGAGYGGVAHYGVPRQRVRLTPTATTRARETDSSHVIEIPAQGEAELEIRFQLSECHGLWSSPSLVIRPDEGLNAIELDGRSKHVGLVELPKARSSLLSSNPFVKGAADRYVNFSNWCG